jgi:dTDP-glucose 4,6-dehydratase
MTMEKVLLTGAGGFVGSHVLRHLLMTTEAKVVCPVTFSHKGLSERIASSLCDRDDQHRVDIIHWDLTSPPSNMALRAVDGCDVIMNVASESHVDRSIEDPFEFIMNNTALTLRMLDLARVIRPKVFLQMSTDEVYGPAYGARLHKEWDTILPSNPYSASKAGQEAHAFAYWRTYGVPVIITNTMNIIGEMQSSEKFFPKVMRTVRDGGTVTIHCSPDGTPGSRFYLHARNLADAWCWLAKRITSGEWGIMFPSDGAQVPPRYNIVGEMELDNVTMAQHIADAMGKDLDWECVDFHSSRPGHDLRYALDGTKLATAGWKAPVPLLDSLRKTVEWTLEHPEWLDA